MSCYIAPTLGPAVKKALTRDSKEKVDHPAHYNAGGVECIDALEAALGPEGFAGFCVGNAIKYLWRYRHKGAPAEDLKKALWYINRLLPKNAKS